MTASHEFILPRPGHRLPWVGVIQPTDDGTAFAWAVYSQSGSTHRPFFRGTAESIEAAREEARKETEDDAAWKELLTQRHATGRVFL